MWKNEKVMDGKFPSNDIVIAKACTVMNKNDCNSESAKRGISYKGIFYPYYQIISFVLGAFGAFILVWCGYRMGNPFPYASNIGVGLFIAATLISVVFDRSKWSKKRKDYPDNLGGGSC